MGPGWEEGSSSTVSAGRVVYFKKCKYSDRQ